MCCFEDEVKDSSGAKQKTGAEPTLGYVLPWPCTLPSRLSMTYWHFAVRSRRDWQNCLLKTRRETVLMNTGITELITKQIDPTAIGGQSWKPKPDLLSREPSLLPGSSQNHTTREWQ